MFFKNCLALMGVPGIMGTYLLDVININYGQPQVVANEVTWLIEWWGERMDERSFYYYVFLSCERTCPSSLVWLADFMSFFFLLPLAQVGVRCP